MFFTEPPHTGYDVHFRIFGIPVRIHPMFWIIAACMGASGQSAMSFLAWMIALLATLLVHEMGHALVMRSYGLAPMIVLHGVGGLAIPSMRPSRPISRWDDLIISLAGPVSEIFVAMILFAALRYAGYVDSLHFGLPYLVGFDFLLLVGTPFLTIVLLNFMWLSIFWGLLNLLPIYPLDGGHISRQALSMLMPSEGTRLSLMLSVLAAGGMAVLAAMMWHSFFSAFFFGYLAFKSFEALQGPTMY